MKLNRLALNKLIVSLFFIADFFQLFCLTKEITFLNSIFKYAAAILSLIYFVQFTVKHLKLKKLLIEIGVGLGLLYTSFSTHNFSYFIVFCMMIIADGINIKEYVRYITKCIFFEIIICACCWGIGQALNLGIPFWFKAEEKRLSLGFNHANTLAMKIIWCSFGWLLVNTDFFIGKLKRISFVLGYVIVNILGFILTDSSTFIFSFVILLFYFISFKNWGKNAVTIAAQWLYPISSIFIFVISIFRNEINSRIGMISVAIDKFSNYRISMSYLALKNNGITLLGQNIEFNHSWEESFRFGNYTIDSVYSYFFVSIGVVWLILICIGFFKLAKKRNYMISLSIILFSLCSLAELTVLYPTTCYVFIFLSSFFVKERIDDNIQLNSFKSKSYKRLSSNENI